MLPQDEQRTLAEIEQHLRASDPELVRRFEPSADAPPRARRAVRAIGMAGLVLGMFLLTLGFAGENADLALMGAAVLVMDAAWWVTSALVSMLRAMFRHDDQRGRW